MTQVLIADNDLDYLKSVKDVFEASGFKVITASTPTEARQILERKSVNLAILDIRLTDDNDDKDISGLVLAEQASSEIPKIILSSYPTMEVVRRAYAANIGLPAATDFISKMQGVEDLLESSKILVRKSESPNQSSGSYSTDKRISPSSPSRPLRIFLCHSSADKSVVRNLYYRLKNDEFDPWLDEKKILPGQNWQLEIKKAVRNTDIVIVCLSRSSVSKRGFVQTEIKMALDVADEQPEGTIFIIPLKLEECDIPDRLNQWQWVNYLEEDAHDKLLLSLKHRFSEIHAQL